MCDCRINAKNIFIDSFFQVGSVLDISGGYLEMIMEMI